LSASGSGAQRSAPAKGAALFVCLFAAALVAAAIVGAARTSDLILEVAHDFPARFSPDGDGEDDVARITFFVRESDADASVYIVGRDLAPIRTLDEHAALEADDRVTYTWDGRTDDGDPAPIARYRLRVVLPGQDRDMVFPQRIDLIRNGVEPPH
jgi:hypothetical protein